MSGQVDELIINNLSLRCRFLSLAGPRTNLIQAGSARLYLKSSRPTTVIRCRSLTGAASGVLAPHGSSADRAPGCGAQKQVEAGRNMRGEERRGEDDHSFGRTTKPTSREAQKK